MNNETRPASPRTPAPSLPSFLSRDQQDVKGLYQQIADLLEGEDAAKVMVRAAEIPPDMFLSVAASRSLELMIVLRPGDSLPAQLVDPEDGGIEVRVHAVPWGAEAPQLVMLTQRSDRPQQGFRLSMVSGSLVGPVAAGCHLAVEVDHQAAIEVRDWFNERWDSAIPWSDDLPVPPAWPGRSTQAADEWDAFRHHLGSRVDASDLGETDEVDLAQLAHDVEAPENVATLMAGDSDVEETVQARGAMTFCTPPPIDRELSAVYARGSLVTATVADKLPMYRLDVGSDFGLMERSGAGRARASTKIWLDLLPDAARQGVNRLRGEAGRILARHSFRLSDNQQWVPAAALPDLVERLEAIPQMGELETVLGSTIEKYVHEQIPALLNELQQVLRQQQSNLVVTDEIGFFVEQAAVAYLRTHRNPNLKVIHSREQLQFTGEGDESYERAFRLLKGSFEETRERLSKPFARTQRELEGPPVPMLDVVGGDTLIAAIGKHDTRYLARRQLEELPRIESETRPLACEILLNLMRDPLVEAPSPHRSGW